MRGRTAIRILIIGSLYAVLYFTYTFFSLTGSLKGILLQWTSFLFVAGLIYITSIALFLLHSRIMDPLRERSERPIPLLLSGSIKVFCILIFTMIGGKLYHILYFRNLPLGELDELHPGFILQIFLISLFTGIVFAMVNHNLNSVRYLQELRLSTRRLYTQQINLRFDSLRSQISPHFLFNSLNTISSLIYRDIEIADRFIRNLAGVYQTVLSNYEHPLVSLKEELKLVEHYSYLMQVRFEDAFKFEIDIQDNTDSFSVPPLSVQMLMENAIKHNLMSHDNPLTVSVSINGDYLVVRNNFIGDPGHVKIGKDLYKKPGTSKASGIGLQNIKNRYRLLSSKPVIINKDEYFSVSIPLIQADATEMVHK